jgi:metal-sulfur cluster biosynthetic enzyme
MQPRHKPTRRQVLDALREVIEPELDFNIVDLGTIYEVDIQDRLIAVEFILVDQWCRYEDEIRRLIEDKLRETFGYQAVRAHAVRYPPWNPQFMTDEARISLGFPI